MKKHACTVRVLAHTQPQKAKLQQKKCHLMEIQARFAPALRAGARLCFAFLACARMQLARCTAIPLSPSHSVSSKTTHPSTLIRHH